MSVRVGSARIDENGKAHGGAPGDQTGKELSTQSYYLHSKGWRVFRCVDPAKAKKIAECMIAACASPLIGYDQYDRLTLYNAIKEFGFDIACLKKAVETDCSALVRVCLAFAGIFVENFRTPTEPSVLLKSGMFVELTDPKYTKSKTGEYARVGDILVTPVQGHTVVVLDDGAKAEKTDPVAPAVLGDRLLKNGSSGQDVAELQAGLISLGYSCGSWGSDGNFGDATELAVRTFQRDHELVVDGQFGAKSFAAFVAALNEPAPDTGKTVRIAGGNCYVRTEPNKETGEIITVVASGSTWPFLGEISPDGWLKIHVGSDRDGWVSGKYGRLEV